MEEAKVRSVPGPGPVGGPGVDGDPHKGRVQPVRGVPVGQPGHGGDPDHPGHLRCAGGHVEARRPAPRGAAGRGSGTCSRSGSTEGQESAGRGQAGAEVEHPVSGSSDPNVEPVGLWVVLTAEPPPSWNKDTSRERTRSNQPSGNS